MKELRPCPKCNGQATLEEGCYDYDGGDRFYAYSAKVVCAECGLAFEVDNDWPKKFVPRASMWDFAIEAWNKRYERTCRMDAMPTVSGNPPYHIRCTACLGIPSDPDTPFCQWCGARVTGGSLWGAKCREVSFDPENKVFKATMYADSEEEVRRAVQGQIKRMLGNDEHKPLERRDN